MNNKGPKPWNEKWSSRETNRAIFRKTSKEITLGTAIIIILCLTGLGVMNEAQSQTFPGINNLYYIINVHTGKCLDVPNGSRQKGLVVNQYKCHGGKNQGWRIFKFFGRDAFRFVNEDSDMCLEAPKDAWRIGGKLEQNPCSDFNRDQHVRLTRAAKNSETVVLSFISHWCLDIPNGVKKDGQYVQLFRCHEGNNQQWLIVPAF